MTLVYKKIIVLLATLFMASIIAVFYPWGEKVVEMVHNRAYIHGYSPSKNLVVKDVSSLTPAKAVPILMYHGVVTQSELGPNTTREVFIEQMEMLKKEGYETISVKEYDLFRQGKFELPTKPIIITFDDGRKDSFYTTDKILEKLGFKATVFVASVKANERDNFYLNWDELLKVNKTGRWEIEAHGRHSHDRVVIDKKGNEGRYLTSRVYKPDGSIETIEEYKKRVLIDYQNAVLDLENNLGISPSYFAVPLNDYGAFEESNYGGAYGYNEELTARFFKLAFIQAHANHFDETEILESFYNYADSDPLKLKRLDVRNMSASKMLHALERFSPSLPSLLFESARDAENLKKNLELLYGYLEVNDGISLYSGTNAPSARILFGDRGWKNYAVETVINKERGRSASILFYYNDEKNFINLSWSDKNLSLSEHFNGKERNIISYYPLEQSGDLKIMMQIYNGRMSVDFDNIPLIRFTPVKLTRGAAGFAVWDPNGAKSTIKSLSIESLDGETAK